MTNNKPTKKDYFKTLLEIVKGNQELENFINHELELLDKKVNKPKTLSEEDERIMNEIAELTSNGNAKMIKEMQNENEFLRTFSTSKISAMIKKMIDNKEIKREEIKGKAYFSYVKAE